MILQALTEYYNRLAEENPESFALGWEEKRIPFLAVISREGKFLRFEDTRESVQIKGTTKLLARSFFVPILGESKGNGIKANLFWENTEYFFGIPTKKEDSKKDEGGKNKKAKERHSAFVQKIRALQGYLPEDEIYNTAILNFCNETFQEADFKDRETLAVIKKGYVLLAVEGIGPVTDQPKIREAIDKQFEKELMEGTERICLVTGEKCAIATLEPPLKGVITDKAETHIVSINNKISKSGSNGGEMPAFASYMKEKCENSPIGKRASWSYVSALNHLLKTDSRQKMQVGDATMVFWASEKGVPLEEDFIDLFAEPAKGKEDVSEQAAERLFRSVDTGAYVHEDAPTKFYVLGLSPNGPRLFIRFWQVGTVAEMEGRFRQWFEDLRIAHGPKDREDLSLWRLLISTAPQEKSKNISPLLAGSIMRCVLEGTPLPETLLRTLIVRFKSDHEISYPRAKLIKASLNRKWRFDKTKERTPLAMSLDKNNTNIGYRLGRLFAVLERIQQQANPRINATIRDRFYASASSTPSVVFGTLLRTKNFHISKMESKNRNYFERLLGEIIYQGRELPGIAKFPNHLSMEDQGMFAIGYYHQRQDFFTKNNADKEKTETDNKTDQEQEQ